MSGGGLITAVASIGVLVQGRPSIKPEDAAQSASTNENGSTFAMALNEAGGLNGLAVIQKDLLEQPVDVTGVAADQDETKPSAAVSLVAAMLAFPVQPLIQNTEQALKVQQPAVLQSGVQQVSGMADKNQQPAVLQMMAGPQMETAAGFDENVLAGAVADGKSEPADGVKAAVVQKPGQSMADVPEMKTDLMKQGDAAAVEAVMPQKAPGSENAASAGGGTPGQAGDNAEQFKRNVSGGNAHPGSTVKKAEKASNVTAEATITTAAIAQRAGHMQEIHDAQAAQETMPEATGREEHPALQVARATTLALKRGITEYKLRLRPEGLGQIEVTVSTKGSEITLSMKTDNEAARGLILGHADELRTELRAQNYQVNDLTVEVGMDNQGGGEFFASGQQAQQAFEHSRMNREQSQAQQADHQTAHQQRPQPAALKNSTISYRV